MTNIVHDLRRAGEAERLKAKRGKNYVTLQDRSADVIVYLRCLLYDEKRLNGVVTSALVFCVLCLCLIAGVK